MATRIPSPSFNADLTTAVSIDDCILRERVGHVITADLSAELSVTNSTISLAGINASKACRALSVSLIEA